MQTGTVDAAQDVIFDWNQLYKRAPLAPGRFDLVDETLRDGLQSPSVTDPTIEQKIELIHLMEDLGIRLADVGLPGAGKRAKDDVRALVEEIRDSRMKLQPMCAARTMVRDVAPIADIAQRTGMPIEVYAFIGSSPIRLYVESWSLDTLLRRIDESRNLRTAGGAAGLHGDRGHHALAAGRTGSPLPRRRPAGSAPTLPVRHRGARDSGWHKEPLRLDPLADPGHGRARRAGLARPQRPRAGGHQCHPGYRVRRHPGARDRAGRGGARRKRLHRPDAPQPQAPG